MGRLDCDAMAKKSVEVQVFDSDFALFLRDASVTYEIKMESRSKSRLRVAALACVALAVTGIVYLGYFCPDQVCALTASSSSASLRDDDLGRPLVQQRWGRLQQQTAAGEGAVAAATSVSRPGLSYDDVLDDDFQFDMNGHDVMVFLHIQKTGGTSFGRHLVRDLDLARPCTCQRKRKRCYCFRPGRDENWLFSRYSTGWRCGLHADWTELTACVDGELDRHEGDAVKRRYYYITLLREPTSRYLSEFRHVQRGATWRSSRHWCGGRVATPQQLPRCYRGSSWRRVTLDAFAACPHNLAANRQTRMLADLALVGCYNMSYMASASERDRVMLASAKRNLAAMAFFGLTEYQKVGQYVFEETFNLRFLVPFEQHNTTLSSATLGTLSVDQLATVRRVNALDLELYAFARRLMHERFSRLRGRDPRFTERFATLGQVAGRRGGGPGAGTALDWGRLMDVGGGGEAFDWEKAIDGNRTR